MNRLLLLLASVFVVCLWSGAVFAQTPHDLGLHRGERVSGALYSGRSALVAPNGAAATAHPLASRAAVDVLRAGGSAVDAAIAANAMLGLVEPTGCGIGGDLYALIWDPQTEQLYAYVGSGRSPMGLTLRTVQRAAREHGSYPQLPSFGAVTVSVPGAVDGWFALHERFGRRPMDEILAPAIAYAESGAPIPETIAYYWERNRLRLEREFAEGRLEEIENARATYWANGAPAAGSLFRNPDLARTYRALATGGRAAFYEGEIARTVDSYMRRVGGWLRHEDFAAHRGEWVEPLCVGYRQARLCEIGANTQGVAALQIAQVLEGFDLAAMGLHSADSLHVQIEATRLAFADRARHYGDPAFTGVDLSRLIDPAYAAQRRAMIDMDRAMEPPGPASAQVISQGDTTYLAVADASGMMVSLIQSNYRGMGSGLVPDGLGFMLQNRGELFATDRTHANVYAPGKRPFQTIIPAFAFYENRPWLAFGVMGGDMQPQGHVQILVNLIDYGLDLQAAGDAARFRHGGSAEPTGEAPDGRGTVFLEGGIPEAARQGLTARGHRLAPADGSFGGYQAVMRDFQHGTWIAASEMRKDGAADGY